MKASRKATAALILIFAFVAPAIFAADTEAELEQRMKKRAGQVSITLQKYDAFKKNLELDQTRQNRPEMLCKIAKRMRRDAKELARSAELLETHMLLESAETSEETELQDTQRSISELRREIKELRQKLATSKSNQDLAAVN